MIETALAPQHFSRRVEKEGSRKVEEEGPRRVKEEGARRVKEEGTRKVKEEGPRRVGVGQEGSRRVEKRSRKVEKRSRKVEQGRARSRRPQLIHGSWAVPTQQMGRCTAMYLTTAVDWMCYLISLYFSSSTPTKEHDAAVKAVQREAELTPIAEAKKVYVSTQ